MEGLLERDDELARLHAWLAEAGAGRGRVVFVGGEAGIGKTALATTFARRAGPVVRVATGRCDALATPRALGPFLDATTALGLTPPDDRDGLLGCLLDDLRAGAPTLLVVEDAHWADDATLELLAMLGRRAVDLPLLLVVTYRDDEVASDHPLRLVLGDLVTASATVWLSLRPLSEQAVRALAEPYGEAAVASAAELHRRTAGNPFYVTEALGAPGNAVPTTVRLAVLARIARLGMAERAVVDAVAVVPGRAETWLVEALCSPAAEALDACLARGVLVADDGSIGFRHELARLAVEGQLADTARRALHRRAVTALGARPGVDPARVAYHASAGGDNEALARSARQACLLAAARSAHREAVRHGQQALAVRHTLAPDEVAELQASLGFSLWQVAQGDEAVPLLRDAAEYWRAAGDGRREAAVHVTLSSVLVGIGQTRESVAAVQRAVELLEQHPPGPDLAGAYGRLTSCHMLARDRDTAVVWGERAIALAAEVADMPNLGRSLIETGIADVMDGRFEGLDRIREGIALGRRHDLPAVVAGGLSQIGSGCGEMRRYDEAVPALVEGVAYSTKHNLEYGRRYMVSWLARCRFDLGQWEEAEEHARDALTGPRGSAISRFVALNTLGWLRARRGHDDVWPLLDEALEIARLTGHLQRLWPVAISRAEAGWLTDGLAPHVPLLEEVLPLAVQCRHRVAVGELGLWLARAGLAATVPGDLAGEPFAPWLGGDHLGAAAIFRRLGCPYEAAAALADAGDAASLRQALATFERLGSAPMARRVAAALRARGVRMPSHGRRASRAPGHSSGLSNRELEVLRLVAAGFTNPQIAASLYISRKTAEHHVSNILVKLGVASRAEAAVAAVRLGIAGG